MPEGVSGDVSLVYVLRDMSTEFYDRTSIITELGGSNEGTKFLYCRNKQLSAYLVVTVPSSHRKLIVQVGNHRGDHDQSVLLVPLFTTSL